MLHDFTVPLLYLIDGVNPMNNVNALSFEPHCLLVLLLQPLLSLVIDISRIILHFLRLVLYHLLIVKHYLSSYLPYQLQHLVNVHHNFLSRQLHL